MHNISNLTCWVIGEGLAGTENQCLGVADALGVKPVIKHLTLREPWKTLSPTLGFEQWWSFDPLLMPPWPDLVLAAGRKAIAPARYIRKVSGGQSFVVFFQNPRCDLSHFDLVTAPAHDGLEGENVLSTLGAPNRITQRALERELDHFPQLQELARPRVAVLIGGNSKTHRFTDDIAKGLIHALKRIKGSLMITTSRRTPEKLTALLRQSVPHEHFWGGDKDGPNPYKAYLAAADIIIATNDSVSMLSDAASTGKPVYLIALEGSSPKFERFYEGFENHGITRDLSSVTSGKLESWSYEPLNDVQKIATLIKEKLKERL